MSINAKYMVQVGGACSEIIGWICLFLQFFSQKYKNKLTFLRSYRTNHHRICTWCSHIQRASQLPIAIFQTDLEQQHHKKIFGEKRQFFNFNWLPWQRPLRDHQNGTGFIKHFHSSTKPEILVKIHSVVPRIDLNRERPLTFFKK